MQTFYTYIILKILSDETKRRQYDQMLNNPGAFGMGGGRTGATGGPQWSQQEFHGSIDPEELFRKIFGDFNFGGAGRSTGGFNFTDSENASDNSYGYGSSQEVCYIDCSICSVTILRSANPIYFVENRCDPPLHLGPVVETHE